MAQQDAASESRPVIVAISASGAETQSLSYLLSHLPELDLAAVVVVPQSQEGAEGTSLADGLREAGCEVTVVTDGMPIQRGQIYLPPLNGILTSDAGRFRLRRTEDAPGARAIIDNLLLSMIDGGHAQVVAVALTGTDANGMVGFEAVKEGGGLVLAEEMTVSRRDGFSQGDNPAPLADDLVPAAALGRRIGDAIRHLASLVDQDIEAAGREQAIAARASIADLPVAELRPTKDQQEAPIRGLQSTSPELTAFNEDHQPLNSGLQTASEELHSVNKELTTLNGELRRRVEELTRANSNLKNLLESMQIATIFLDSELRITNYTPPVTEIFDIVASDAGRPIGHVKPFVAYDALQEDARRVLQALAPVERVIENPTTRARYMVRLLPYRSTDTVTAGVVLTFVDVTAQRQAEDALRDREQGFRAIVESARDYIILTTDAEGRINEWLPGAAAVFGWSPQEVLGRPPDLIYTPEDRAKGTWQAEFARAREEGVAPDNRWHLRKDGERVFIEGSTRALRDATGRLRGVIKIGQDVTERRRGLEALHESEAKAKLLLAELQHRVRNTLAVMRSIARRTARTARSVEDYASHLEGRLDAFARVQAVVTRNPLAGIDLEQLFASELLAHAAHEGEQIVHIEGPRIRLQPRAAETLALAIHELATNAIKFGALSTPNGRVAVGWRIVDVDPEPRLEISWIESGMKLSGEPPLTQGFGTELIERTLKYDLGGEAALRYEPSGARCSISLPLTDRIVLSRERPPT